MQFPSQIHMSSARYYLGPILLLSTLFGCRGVGPDLSVSCPPLKPAADLPHVVLVVFENQNYDGMFGNPHAAFFTQFAKENALATEFYANVHPSIGDYFLMTTGQTITNDLFFADLVRDDNLAREFCHGGISWKAYLEDLPQVGYTGDRAYPYAKSHNPFAYFTEVVQTADLRNRMVPYTQLAQDLANDTLPSFSLVIPNQFNNTHDCPPNTSCRETVNDDKLDVGDAWLRNNLPPILSNPSFQRNGLLIVTFDESWDTDNRHGGGHIMTILAGPLAKKNFTSSTFFQHESLNRLISNVLRVPPQGAGASAPDMSEFLVNP
jgi:phosphatidylinositol-3-phosphatase